MPSKSKNKGNTFERDISKRLSEMYNESFLRVRDSGAFVGGSNNVRKNILSEGQIRAAKGDIIPPDGWKHFNAECKSYAAFPFHQLLNNEPIPLLENWIEQTVDASDEGDLNIIFMKFNRIGIYVGIHLPIGKVFDIKRFIDYNDKTNNTWRLTGYNNFFPVNRDLFRKICTGTYKNN